MYIDLKTNLALLRKIDNALKEKSASGSMKAIDDLKYFFPTQHFFEKFPKTPDVYK